MGSYNFTVVGGEDKTLDLTWQTTDNDGNSTPYDLTDCEAWMEFRRTSGSTLIATSSTADGTITIEAAEGIIRVELSNVQTRTLSAYAVEYANGLRYLMHDVFVEFPDGTIRQVVNGRVEVTPPISKSGSSVTPPPPDEGGDGGGDWDGGGV